MKEIVKEQMGKEQWNVCFAVIKRQLSSSCQSRFIV